MLNPIDPDLDKAELTPQELARVAAAFAVTDELLKACDPASEAMIRKACSGPVQNWDEMLEDDSE